MVDEANSYQLPSEYREKSLQEAIDLLSDLKKQIGIGEIIEEVKNDFLSFQQKILG